MNKKILWGVVVLGILFFVLGIIDGYKEAKSENNNDNSYKLSVYGIKDFLDNSLYVCDGQSVNCNDIVLTIDTETDNAVIVDLGGEEVTYGILSNKDVYSYIVYYDNGLKMYDLNKKESHKIELDVTLDGLGSSTYPMFLNGGFIYSDEDETYYYDLKSNKKMYAEYDSIDVVRYVDTNYLYSSEYKVSNEYLNVSKNNEYFLIELKTGKKIITRKLSDELADGGVGEIDFYVMNYCGIDNFFASNELAPMAPLGLDTIYDQNGKLIKELKNNEDISLGYCQYSDGYLEIYEKSNVREYNSNGKLVK